MSFRGDQKVENGAEKESRSTVLQLFELFFDSVFDFWALGREAPGTHFRTLFQLRARRAQMTPVAGPRNPNFTVLSMNATERVVLMLIVVLP